MAKITRPDEVGRPGIVTDQDIDRAVADAVEPEKPAPKQKLQLQGEVKTHKKTFGDKVYENENVKSTRNYIIQDVLIPALQDTIVNMISGGIETLVYGQSRGSSRARPRSNTTYVSYSNASRQPQQPARQARTLNRDRIGKEIDPPVLTSRDDANLVLNTMCDLIGEYGCASLADLYDLLEMTSSFVDYNWGWRENFIREANVRRCREGWMLELPPLEKID